MWCSGFGVEEYWPVVGAFCSEGVDDSPGCEAVVVVSKWRR